MGKKTWSQKLFSLTYTKLPVLLKYPKGLSFRGVMEREDRSAWSGLGWKDLGIHRGDPLHAAACVSGRKLSGVKFYLRVPFVLFIILGHHLLCLPGAVWTLTLDDITSVTFYSPQPFFPANMRGLNLKQERNMYHSPVIQKIHQAWRGGEEETNVDRVDMSQSKWERVAPGTVWQCPGKFLSLAHQI